MNLINTEIDGLFILEPKVWHDERGWFIESYSSKTLSEIGINTVFIQDNHSFSKKARTLRGIHYQAYPYSQSKLMRCTRGKILNVVLDLRKKSKTFQKWVGIVLSEENFRQLYIPKGMASAVLSLVDNTEIQYKVDDEYVPQSERGIYYNDTDLKINWELDICGLSEKDKHWPFLRDLNTAELYD